MLHPNEVKVTEQNKEELMQLAQTLGSKHVAALKEQITRQGV